MNRVGLLLALAVAAPQAPMISTPLDAPYQPPADVLLVQDGQPRAVPLVPDGAAIAEPAGRKLQAALGMALPRVKESEYRPDGRALVLYGNAFTGGRCPIAPRASAIGRSGATW